MLSSSAVVAIRSFGSHLECLIRLASNSDSFGVGIRARKKRSLLLASTRRLSHVYMLNRWRHYSLSVFASPVSPRVAVRASLTPSVSEIILNEKRSTLLRQITSWERRHSTTDAAVLRHPGAATLMLDITLGTPPPRRPRHKTGPGPSRTKRGPLDWPGSNVHSGPPPGPAVPVSNTTCSPAMQRVGYFSEARLYPYAERVRIESRF